MKLVVLKKVISISKLILDWKKESPKIKVWLSNNFNKIKDGYEPEYFE